MTEAEEEPADELGKTVVGVRNVLEAGMVSLVVVSISVCVCVRGMMGMHGVIIPVLSTGMISGVGLRL
jgi:hypothetical protein